MATTSARTRTDPVVAHVPNFLRWGAGVGITPNDHWLIHGELLGRTWQRDNTSLDGTLVAEDGTLSPIVTETEQTASFTTGVTWFATNGFFVGGELRWDTPMRERINASEDSNGDFVDYHVRIGWSPRRFVPPPPPSRRRPRRHRRLRALTSCRSRPPAIPARSKSARSRT